MTRNKKISRPVGGDYVVAIDIGTAEIRVCSAIIYNDDEFKIAGYGRCTSHGFSEDGISSMDKLKEDISTAYNTANSSVRRIYDKETLFNIDNPRIFVSVSGKYMVYRNNDGSREINQRKVTAMDIDKAFASAQSLNIEGYELITATNNYYSVDSNMYLEDPRGQIGGQLKSYAHLIYVDKIFLTNIRDAINCCVSTKYEPEFLFNGYAAASAVVDEYEQDLGVCVLDIGHGSVDITIFNRGFLIFSGSSPFAGHMVTRDIAVLNGLSEDCAEDIKIKYGSADPDTVRDNSSLIRIHPAGVAHREINIQPQNLAEMIEAKYSQLLLNAISSIKGVDDNCKLGAGFVLTGSGAKIPGIENCLAKVLKRNNLEDLAKKIRIGKVADKLTGLSDEIDTIRDATVIGLLKFSQDIDSREAEINTNSKFKRFISKVGKFFQQEM